MAKMLEKIDEIWNEIKFAFITAIILFLFLFMFLSLHSTPLPVA